LSSNVIAVGRAREQRRGAAGHEAQDEVVGRQAADMIEQGPRTGGSGFVRYGMRGLDHADGFCWCRMAVTRDDRPFERALPRSFQRLRHRRRRLAATDHDRSSSRRTRQIVCKAHLGIGRRDSFAEKRCQKCARFHGVSPG
jgi:hypothetical protein